MNREPLPSEEKKKSSLDIAQLGELLKPVGVFFKRHLVVLFVALALSALIYAVFSVNLILQQVTTSEAAATSKYDTHFDQKTIDKINALSSKDQTPTINLPSGRINPFSE